MSRSTTQLDDRLYEYFLEVSVRDDDLHRRLREETGKLENARMQISPEQGQFMTLLVGAMNAKLALELGTFTGYSALCIAEGYGSPDKMFARGGRLPALSLAILAISVNLIVDGLLKHDADQERHHHDDGNGLQPHTREGPQVRHEHLVVRNSRVFIIQIE